MNVPAPPVPADATVFKFSRRLRVLMAGCAAIGFGFLILGLSLPFTSPGHGSLAILAMCVVVFGSATAAAILRYLRFRDSIAVSSDGVWYLRRQGEPSFIAWSDVAHVEAHDTAQCLVLVDARDGARIRIKYQIENFAKLRDLVVSHVSTTARVPAVLPSVFHRTPINKGVFLIFAAACLFFVFAHLNYASPQGAQVAKLLFTGFAVALLILITQDPSLVLVADNGIVIKYPGWKRTIPFDTIKGIVLTNLRNTQGDVWATVLVERKKGRPIKLMRFREGSIAMQDALHSAWVSAGGRELDTAGRLPLSRRPSKG